MRILLVCFSFDGLVQRVWLALRRAGHEVSVELALSERLVMEAVRLAKPDLVICPSAAGRAPAPLWEGARTVVIRPGPPGDRGPFPLERAIAGGVGEWGVTALQAGREMEGAPVWGHRMFAMPAEPPRRSALYRGPVAEAAAELVLEVADRAADPGFVPESPVPGGPVVRVREPGGVLSWEAPTEEVVRRVRAADGEPGLVAELCGLAVRVFDVYRGPVLGGAPGVVAGRREGAVLVHTGDGTVWVGQLRAEERGAVTLPAASVLGGRLDGVRERPGFSEITYDRGDGVGVVGFDFYEGAMSAGQCRRLVAALRYAAAQDTRVLVVRGGEVFSRGVHLKVIEAARYPELEAWMNVTAFGLLCRELVACTGQLVVTSVGGDAWAGGVMLALGGDRVMVRSGVVLNPHFRTLGLSGGGLWAYVLPRRVGARQARRLAWQALPVGAQEAVELGLADRVVPGSRPEFEGAVLEYADRLASSPRYERLLAAKREAREADERRKPLEAYRAEELAELSRDVFGDRRGFGEARRAFVHGRRPACTPARLALHRRGSGASPAPDAEASHM
ncbi:enoyl-CoA hydratase-related protein [Nonomuraea sp. C10]|uniref:enoyl-CoA hydratase-related protein n=1 Tax=Nonomuraea sp. C10 TaxID=2600577 RepID=UPI0011CE4286|nr:enoyl-CoA hydratase-related protein [Nonomuraea sp. C10]TXK40761.1 formyl transferase [Nonomuraea sp. C10]